MYNIVIYLRVSSEEQRDEGHSIEQQRSILTNLVKSNHENYNLIELNDEGYSANNQKRKDYNKLKKMIENFEVDFIYSMSLDRLNRDLLESIIFLRMAALSEVTIVLPHEKIDLSIPERELSVYIRVLFAYFETRIISFRTKNGIEGGFRKGKYTLGGRAPFGYIRDDNKNLIKDEDTKETVENIIYDYVYTSMSINFLSEKYSLDDSTVTKILCDTSYRGYIYYNNSKYIFTNDSYIDEETDILIKTKLNYYKKKEKYVYLFKDKLVCSKCNSILKAKSTKKKTGVYLYYRCVNEECSCYNKQINEVIVFQLLKNYLDDIFLKYSNDIIDRNIDNNLIYQIESKKNKISNYKNRQKRLLNSYLSYDIDSESYRKKKESYENLIRKEQLILDDLLGGYNYNKFLKSKILSEHMDCFYINLIKKTSKEKRI